MKKIITTIIIILTSIVAVGGLVYVIPILILGVIWGGGVSIGTTLILLSIIIIPNLLKSVITFIFLKKSEIQIRFWRILGTVIIAVIVSFPFVFLSFAGLFSDVPKGGSLMRSLFLILMVICIIFVEGLVIYGINKELISFKKAVIASLIMNIICIPLLVVLFNSAPAIVSVFNQPVQDICGDGGCGANEMVTCPQDCKDASPTPSAQGKCGDGTCDGPETSVNCSVDCKNATPQPSSPTQNPCGDGVCDDFEKNNSKCPQDCKLID